MGDQSRATHRLYSMPASFLGGIETQICTSAFKSRLGLIITST
jgi:hypothetical protein